MRLPWQNSQPPAAEQDPAPELHPRDWKLAGQRYGVYAVFLLLWGPLGYGLIYLSGLRLDLQRILLLLPYAWLAQFEARRYDGAALNENRVHPTWRGAPFGAAPWLATVALQVSVAVAGAAIVAVATSDELAQYLVVVTSALLALGAGWLLDLRLGREDRADARAFDLAEAAPSDERLGSNVRSPR